MSIFKEKSTLIKLWREKKRITTYNNNDKIYALLLPFIFISRWKNVHEYRNNAKQEEREGEGEEKTKTYTLLSFLTFTYISISVLARKRKKIDTHFYYTLGWCISSSREPREKKNWSWHLHKYFPTDSFIFLRNTKLIWTVICIRRG